MFGNLLMFADPVFDSVVRSVLDWDFRRIASHLLLAGFFAWISVGYLRDLSSGSHPLKDARREPNVPPLGILEVGIALGTTILIFLLYVVVQIEYLFSGEEMIRTTMGLSYAEYARRGFFELVAVEALVVPALLAS